MKKLRAGRMDPAGEALTTTAYALAVAQILITAVILGLIYLPFMLLLA